MKAQISRGGEQGQGSRICFPQVTHGPEPPKGTLMSRQGWEQSARAVSEGEAPDAGLEIGAQGKIKVKISEKNDPGRKIKAR